MERLRSYKMMYDTGFAPNPYGGMLTLATCMPQIRRVAQEGEWIAGFTSKGLDGSESGKEKLIFLMKIDEIMEFNIYYNTYKNKIPSRENTTGDNIYYSNGDKLVQLKHNFHVYHKDKKSIYDDTKINRVLIAKKEFYYIGGKEPYEITEEICRPLLCNRSAYGRFTEGERLACFLECVRKNFSNKFVGIPYGA